MKNKTVLVLAPHADDEVLGCGGTMAKYSRIGYSIHVCYVTSPTEPEWTESYLSNRKKSISNSNRILGVSEKYEFNLPTVMLDTIPQKKINSYIHELAARIRPDIVFIPHRGDCNMDHRIVHDAALVAFRPVNHSHTNIFAYETLSETEWGTIPFNPVYYIPLLNEDIDKKIEAMVAYSDEFKCSPSPRSEIAMRALARFRGSTIFSDAAEAFIPLRIIEE
jgi:N-acetylglucosamine malate deacetylase 1